MIRRPWPVESPEAYAQYLRTQQPTTSRDKLLISAVTVITTVALVVMLVLS